MRRGESEKTSAPARMNRMQDEADQDEPFVESSVAINLAVKKIMAENPDPE